MYNVSNSEIYSNLLPRINTIYQKYSFLKLSNTDLKKLVMEVIKENKSKENESISEEKIINDIDVVLFEVVKKRLEDNKKIIKLLNNYIELNIDDKRNSVSEINKLTNFLREFDIIPEPDIILELINYNEKLKNILKKLFEKYGNQDNIFDDELLNLIYDTYCLVNSDNFIMSSNNLAADSGYIETSTYKLYMRDLKTLYEIDLLSDEEEQEIFRNMTIEGKKRIVEKHLRLVPWFVNKYFRNREISVEDLIQEGNLGLITAVERFDIKRKLKFSTYAVIWIRQAVTRALYTKSRTIKVAVGKLNTIGRMNRIISKLELSLGREPNAKEIAEEMNITEDEVYYLSTISKNDPISLNKPLGDENDAEFGDSIPSDFDIEDVLNDDAEFGKILLDIMNKSNYSERDKEMIILRFGLFENHVHRLEEIGLKYGITRERVRQLLEKIYTKLSHNYEFREYFSSNIKGRSKRKKDKSNSKKETTNGDTKSKNNSRGWQVLNIYDRLSKRLKVSNTPEFKQEIKELILGLPEDKKNVLINRFGANFDEIKLYDDWDKDKQKEVENAIIYVFRLYLFLKKGGNREEFDNFKELVIYEKLAGLLQVEDTIEFRMKIDEIMSGLSEKQKDVIFRAYGDDLTQVNRSSNWNSKVDYPVLSKTIAIIKKIYKARYIGIKKSNLFIPFYDYFAKRLDVLNDDNLKVRISEALLELDATEIFILKVIYGDDFNASNSYNDYSPKVIKLRNLIIEKLVKIMQHKEINGHLFIDDYVGKYDFNIICKACDMLPKFDKSIVKRLFGDNYDLEYSIQNVSIDEENYFKNSIIKKIILNISIFKDTKNVKTLSKENK